MSSPISWAAAQSYATTYQNSSEALKNSNNQVLKGFTIDATHVRSVLGLSGIPTVPNLFIIMGLNTNNEFTPIIAGLDSTNNIVTTNLYDMAMPCPSACPNNF